MSAHFGTRSRTGQTGRTCRTSLTRRTNRAFPITRTKRLRSHFTATRTGYTLIELVSVAALAVVLISISVGGYHLWIRDTAVDAAQRQVRAALTRARAYALARDVETRFVASNASDRCFTVLDYRATPTNAWVSFTATNQLPRYIGVDMEVIRRDGGIPPDESLLYFNPDGTLRWDDDLYEDPSGEFQHHLRVVIFHTKITDDPRYHRYLDVSRLTGLVRDVPPGSGPEVNQ